MTSLRLLKALFMMLLSVCTVSLLNAQNVTVTGKVTDKETGKPIEGVSVKVKNNTAGTQTNAEGNFSIAVPSTESILTFTSVGFTYFETKAGTGPLSIGMMATNSKLDEVVVIGYGATQKARNTTGSVVPVDIKKMEDLPVASISEMLRGQVPGLNVTGGSTRPGALASVSIRQQFNWGKDGGGTIPLVVIDDVVQIDPATNLPTLDAFNRLDLSEVESITVIRDASAAIYGTRASQGAIVVRTKRGKIGAPKISYSGKFQTNDAISHSKVMNAKEYGIFSNRLQRALGSTNPNNFFSDAELASMDSLNYDWLQDWHSAGAMQHSLNVSGGSDKASYFAGGSYYKQGANLGSQDFNRWTFRSGTDVKVMNSVKLSVILSAASTNVEKSFTKINFSDGYASGGEQNDYSVLLHMPKYIPWQYTVNGVTSYVSPVLGPNKAGSATGNNSLSNWNYYALLNNGSFTTNKNFNYTGNFSLQYDLPFVKGLSVRGNYAITNSSGNTEQVQMPIQFYQGGNLATANNHLYSPTTTWGNLVTNRSNSRVTYDNTTSNLEQINLFVNYENTFGEHNVSAMFSGEQSKITNEDRYQIYENPIPGVYNGTSVSAGTLNASNTITYRQIGGTQSYLGRVGYSFKNRYLANFMFRSDASSKFAPENRWALFPSLSVGWIISDESFFKNINFINYLKIRASVGKTGNDNVKAWKWLQLYQLALDKGMAFGTSGGNYTYGITPDATPNRDIKWDKTIQRNFGIDFSMFKSRLSVTLDGYYNSSTDMLTSMTGAINVPISVGGAFAEQNYSSINFWGSEISATWNDRIGKDFTYSVGMNFGWSDNKVVKFLDQPYNNPSFFAGKQQVGYSMIGAKWGYRTWKQTSTGDGILRTDADLDAYWAYLADLATKAGTTPLYNAGGANISNRAGMRKGMMAYEDVAGDLNSNTRTIAGKNGRIIDDQDYVELVKRNQSYGISTNLSAGWKSITLMAQIQTGWGGWNSIDRVKQGTSSTNAGWSQVAYLTDMYDSTDNPNGRYPNMAFYDAAYKDSDFWTLSSFRCVVRSLSIGYTIPKEILAKLHISSAKFVVSGYNLWDLSNPYPGKYRNMYDGPDVGYPTLRTWSLGINLGF
ncbi:MAG: SusC/RagA family TonB-linked outer membrane protein [Chitinophagaceae bacterium]|nr:MAG: SusC/RagA family TonB-linked outer membrane protein [Chitinophagaceae bacterium]